MKKINILGSLVLTSLLSSQMLADPIATTDVAGKYSKEVSLAETETLKQSIDLGFANTSGNTKILNVNGKYALSNQINNEKYAPFKYNFSITGFLSKDDKTTTAEEYTANLNGEQELANKWLAYITADWLKNEFKNYDNKTAISLGVGKILLDDGKQKLTVKLGVGYVMEDFSNEQDSENYGTLNQYIEYTNVLNKLSILYIKVGAAENFDDLQEDYEATALLGVNFIVGSHMHLTIEEELIYDNLPPEGFKKTDTKSIIRLGYEF